MLVTLLHCFRQVAPSEEMPVEPQSDVEMVNEAPAHPPAPARISGFWDNEGNWIMPAVF
jgi:hypothetical protein